MYMPRHIVIAAGLAASLVLTAAAFALVQTHLFSRQITLQLIGALAVLQILIHFRYFLHLRFRREERERVIALAFAILVALIMTVGTLWIMSDLKHRMM
jgi:cytochrome o ubiquinol oxidase subunit IV